MKRFGLGTLAVAVTVATAGCANGLHGHTQNYDQLPGSGDHMAEGPGLIHTKQTDQNYQGGMRVFSDNPGQGALINPNANQQQPTATDAANNGAAASTTTQPTPSQQQQYRQFQQYQQFKNFQHMSKDSPEYQKFREWQEWKQYQQWQKSGHQ
ncbi:MAG: hypothetical protein WBL23_17270 [Salinisphaera sp.]|uniref:hypothetical protein n=1 Tax=Salinisphaera sp. TaxID=1914330 RepID=UPI003C7B6DC0